MPAALFDTLKASRTLQDAGLTARHAEAIVETVAGAFDDTVATKADVAEVRAELAIVKEALKHTATRTDVAEVHADVAEVRAELAVVKEALKHTATRTEVAEIRAAVADSFSALYRHLWVMALGIVTAMVGLSKLLDWLFS